MTTSIIVTLCSLITTSVTIIMQIIAYKKAKKKKNTVIHSNKRIELMKLKYVNLLIQKNYDKTSETRHIAMKLKKASAEYYNNISNIENIFNSKIIEKIISLPTEKAISDMYEKVTKMNKKFIEEVCIVSDIAKNKAIKNRHAYIITLISMVLYIVMSKIFLFTFEPSILIILTILLVLVYTNQRILEYRISKGFYGSNETEAREIIKFILENNDKYSNGKRKKVTISKADYERLSKVVRTSEIEGLQYE